MIRFTLTYDLTDIINCQPSGFHSYVGNNYPEYDRAREGAERLKASYGERIHNIKIHRHKGFALPGREG